MTPGAALIALLAGSAPLFIGVCAVLGLLVGSFLNVVIYRVPVMLERQWRRQCLELDGATAPDEAPFNLIVPRSACPGCKAPITALQNIPVLSYLFQRGRCAGCGMSIGVRYPLVELLTGIASALVAWRFGFAWATAAGLVLTWFLVALTFIDFDTQLLPDNLTLPLLWLGLLVSLLLPIVLTASAAGAVVGLALIGLRGKDRSVPMAFGPFLAAAGYLMLLFGHDLVERYLSLYGPH